MKSIFLYECRVLFVQLIMLALVFESFCMPIVIRADKLRKKQLTVKSLPNDPLKFSNPQRNGKELNFGELFDDGDNDDWLNGLSFDIQNTTNRTITYVKIDLILERMSTSGNPVKFPLILGLNDKEKKKKVDVLKSDQNIEIKPDGLLNVRISDGKYQQFLAFLERAQWQDQLYNVQVMTSMVIFSDDSSWINGFTMRRDSTDPLKWLPMRPIGTSRYNAPRSVYFVKQNFLEKPIESPRNLLLKRGQFPTTCAEPFWIYETYCGINGFYQCYNLEYALTPGLYLFRRYDTACYDGSGNLCTSSKEIYDWTGNYCTPAFADPPNSHPIIRDNNRK